ncbi:MAG TPA: sigma-70 family RNA polymerase sigma factor [Terracidiphilus sp.]|nr:sigma-70 family RNA polymerase sigma factor [Terracidiphilus sp.]
MRPELIQASELLQRNTPEAVEEAIGLLQGTVYSFSMKVCGHREDAEDTMQEVLFRSLKHLAKIPDAQALAAWLYTVTRNRCRRLRRPQSGAPARNLSLDELMPDNAELQQLLVALDTDAEGEVLHAEEQHLLHEAVLRIAPSLRMVLVLHDMEELSTGEISRILALQEGTVRVRLHRARLAVRKEMSFVLRGQPDGSRHLPSSGETSAPGNVPGSPRSKECRELFANLSEYLDERVEPRTCAQIKAHIEACPACVAFLKDLRAAIDRCRSLDIPCDPAVAHRMRAMMTREYLRLLGTPLPD